MRAGYVPGGSSGGDRVELADVAEGVGPQVRAQCGRGPAGGEESAHAPPVAQRPHVGAAVGTGDRPRHQGGDLCGRIGPGRAGHRDAVCGELVQPGRRCRAHHRDKPSGGHEIGIIKISGNAVRA